MLLLGDSFTEGFSVALEDGVARALERDLRRDGCAAEVVNGGTVGYSTDQEYLFYRDEGVSYSPRIVVLLFYYNDILYNARAAVPGGVPKPLFTFTGGNARVKNYPLPPPLPPMPPPRPWRGSVALTYFRERLRDGAPRTYDALAKLRFWSPIRRGEAPIEMLVYDREPPEPVVQAWLQTEHLLALLQREVAAHGARLFVAYIPSKMEVSRGDWELTRRRYRVDESLWDRRLVARRLETAGQRLGVPVLDLTDALWAEQGRAYFAQGGHWNARGHAVAAREIAHFLQRATPCRVFPIGAPPDGGSSGSSRRIAMKTVCAPLVLLAAVSTASGVAGPCGAGGAALWLAGRMLGGRQGHDHLPGACGRWPPRTSMLGVNVTTKPAKPAEFEYLRIETTRRQADLHGPAREVPPTRVRAERGGLDARTP